MPEGDTIFRAARTLNRALAGQPVTGFETQLPHLSRTDHDTPIAGRTVESVTATGKWLHMKFSGDLILLTHMLMNGSWHIYRPGERWQRPRHQMRIVVHTAAFVAVAFKIQIAEFHTPETLQRRRSVSRLGPDILSPEFDGDVAAAGIVENPGLETGVALLNQSLIAGLGNVFKSEVCFVSGVNPFRTTGSLTPEELKSLISNARALMLANVMDPAAGRLVTSTGFRNTTGRTPPSERLWVYARKGQPCRRCGAEIQARKQGLDARVTFWCPECQPG